MKILLSIFLPLILIFLGFAGYRIIEGNHIEKWNPTSTYAVWIEDMEVSAKPVRGGKWDDDGSAPDIVASLNWRDNVVLKTSEASNTLLPHWERTAIQLSDLLKSNFSPTELENIARIRCEGNELLFIEARDVDILSAEWVGAISIPCGSLITGKNKIVVNRPDTSIRSVTLRVAPEEQLERGQLTEKTNEVIDGVLVMEMTEDVAPGAVEVREVGKQLEAGAEFLKGFFNSGEKQ